MNSQITTFNERFPKSFGKTSLKACEESAQQARPSLDGNKILPTYPQTKQSKIRGSLLEVLGGWGDF